MSSSVTGSQPVHNDSAVKFYGAHRIWPDKNNQSRILNQLKKRSESVNENPLAPEFKSRLEGPTVMWKVCKHQQEALDVAKDYKDVSVFSFEIQVPGEEGKRNYIVTHVEHMWTVHKSRPAAKRCTYEVICEGSPSKLYMDLEYKVSLNPDKDGNAMVKLFIECTCLSLKEMFNIECDESCVLWLDSSTDSKYSCHLIFQLPKCAFKNNKEAGKFVSILCTKIMAHIQWNRNRHAAIDSDDVEGTISSWPSGLELLLVKDDKGNERLFCDLAVYSRNRNFRMFLSTKYGKNVPLVVSPLNMYCPDGFEPNTPEWEKQIFLDSLVTNIKQSENMRLLSFDDTSYSENKSSIDCQQYFTYNDDSDSKGEYLQGRTESSPYPEVDEFVADLVSKGSQPGFIRHWRYFKDTEVLQYSIGKFRFCKNIGRHHKSNNIMIIVQLRNRLFYQKCFDPDCKGFRSKAYPLPLHATPAYFFLEEASLSDMNISEDISAKEDCWANDVWENGSFTEKALQVLDEVESITK